MLDGRKIDPKRAEAIRKDGKLFVGGIKTETDNEKIKEYFSNFGEVCFQDKLIFCYYISMYNFSVEALIINNFWLKLFKKLEITVKGNILKLIVVQTFPVIKN